MERPSRTRAARLAALVLAAASLALGGCAGRGAITGRVRMPHDRPKDVVVMAWLEDGSPPPMPLERARVVQAAGRFEPRVLVVEAGTTVEFENRDRVFHRPFSVSPTTRFTLGPTRPGEIRTSSFARAGVVEVFCELHPREVLYVVVVPGRWHARPAPDGAFAFERLPRGSYLLRAWHPARGQVTRRVEVPLKSPALLTFER